MLRQSIAFIPQQPFLLQGTVRENLDPFTEKTDEEIWQVLREVKLDATVKGLNAGLLTIVTESSNLFSVGQKQLICLARAMLLRTKILVLDEATANVDLSTDNFIQFKLREQFMDNHSATVMIIAHRLATVIDADRILVMSDGTGVEYDHPFNLLVESPEDDCVTNDAGHFAKMIKATGV